MSKKNKESKVLEVKYAMDRNILKVSVFKDEYEKLGITEETSVSEAVTLIRGKLDLPKRFKSGSVRSKVRGVLKEATDEELEKMLAIVTPKE